jgi:hypothetical protein
MVESLYVTSNPPPFDVSERCMYKAYHSWRICQYKTQLCSILDRFPFDEGIRSAFDGNINKRLCLVTQKVTPFPGDDFKERRLTKMICERL